MTKSSAIMVQLSTSDGDSKQQMVVFANNAVFRRSMTGTTRTRWRHASVGDLPTWVHGYVNLTKASPTPMSVSHGPTLMEVTDDEATEADGGAFPRNVGLRYARVMEGMDADPTTNVPVENVEQYVKDWLDAQVRDDNAWIDGHIHPQGTCKVPTAPE